jgi:hypothetical protein
MEGVDEGGEGEGGEDWESVRGREGEGDFRFLNFDF